MKLILTIAMIATLCSAYDKDAFNSHKFKDHILHRKIVRILRRQGIENKQKMVSRDNAISVRQLQTTSSKSPSFSSKSPSFSSKSPSFSSKSPSFSSKAPTAQPSDAPTESPTAQPSELPTARPSDAPTQSPTARPSDAPTQSPTAQPSESPTARPSDAPTQSPTAQPSELPTESNICDANSEKKCKKKIDLGCVFFKENCVECSTLTRSKCVKSKLCILAGNGKCKSCADNKGKNKCLKSKCTYIKNKCKPCGAFSGSNCKKNQCALVMGKKGGCVACETFSKNNCTKKGKGKGFCSYKKKKCVFSKKGLLDGGDDTGDGNGGGDSATAP